MNITPIHCPDSGCFWSAHGIPDQYTEARDWHLAAHRAEEHGEPLTEEQIAYATRAGHVIPGTAKTTAAAVAALGALPVPVGDQPQPLDDQRLAEITARTPERAAALTAWLNQFAPVGGQRALENAETVLGEDVPALLAEVQRLRASRWDATKVVERLESRLHATHAELTRALDRVAELEKAAEEIRFLHKDSPMGPCPTCVDGDAMARGDDPTVPYPCPTARLAGATDCDPPSFRPAKES
ncbi:hypothetical protein [Streptomyces griseoloalbus]|uniref:Uncharacterized protein n=1 Tax=Streptomyces griseoloalbus TaxID=67303 RepID=A0A7W8BX83_9ACTN|nr:hypothetical protein [Streptomyces albaduncus]MBB5130253.1 hypothetical protein [Streptomyces albaduncus]GGW50004.1 hypothetical protein GCM10010340_30300 [Streptomyces albaduncus]